MRSATKPGDPSLSRAPKQQISRFFFLKETILLEQHCLGSAAGFLDKGFAPVVLNPQLLDHHCNYSSKAEHLLSLLTSLPKQLLQTRLRCSGTENKQSPSCISSEELRPGSLAGEKNYLSYKPGWGLMLWPHWAPLPISNKWLIASWLCPTNGVWHDDRSTTHSLHKHPHPPLHPGQPPLHDAFRALCKEVAASWEVEPRIFSDGFKDKELHVL